MLLSIVHSANSQENYRAPNGIVITPDAHIHAAEGELLLFCGDMRQVSPYAYQPVASDTIKFSTVANGVQYQFRVTAPFEIQFSTEAEAILAATIEVNVTNITQETRKAIVSCGWQNAYNSNVNGNGGILLRLDENPNMLSVPYELQWQDQWTWLFVQNAFVRGSQVLYWLNSNDTWETSAMVRQNQFPYQTINQRALLGIQQISGEIPSGEKNSFEIWLPYVPIPIEQYRLWLSSIPQ